MEALASREAVKAAVGREIGPSDWIEVAQERIDRFAEATGDFQWIHVDAERAARESPFGATVAHGYLTLSLVPRMVQSMLRYEGVRRSLNYGLNRVRFPAPVIVGSRLRGRLRLKAAEDAGPGALRVLSEVTVEIEGGERPACTAETMAVHYWP